MASDGRRTRGTAASRLSQPRHQVLEGECNTTIPAALAELRSLNWAPTFAFLDPDGMELAGETIAALAEYKRGYRAAGSLNPEYKIELWMLFPTSGIVRTLALEEEKVSIADEARATRLFGTDRGRPIYELRVAGAITGGDAREEYVNLDHPRTRSSRGWSSHHPKDVTPCRRAGPLPG